MSFRGRVMPNQFSLCLHIWSSVKLSTQVSVLPGRLYNNCHNVMLLKSNK
jgi:hypothetical protein